MPLGPLFVGQQLPVRPWAKHLEWAKQDCGGGKGVGEVVGDAVGGVGNRLGLWVGSPVGRFVGETVGGDVVGASVGAFSQQPVQEDMNETSSTQT